MFSRLAVLAVLALLTSVACRSEAPANELTVYAAASLTDVFEDMAKDFERENPGTSISLSFAGSQSLRTQIEHGAQPDLFASANHNHLDRLRKRGLVTRPLAFATNRLVIVVPPENPAGIKSLADLRNAERLVLADTSVPAGAYAESILQKLDEDGAGVSAGILKRVVSRELHVRQALHKVVVGEADAAMVYATDAASAGNRVEIIEIPASFNVKASYPIATINGTHRSVLAKRFVDHLRSPSGSAVLVSHGFRPAEVITAGR